MDYKENDKESEFVFSRQIDAGGLERTFDAGTGALCEVFPLRLNMNRAILSYEKNVTAHLSEKERQDLIKDTEESANKFEKIAEDGGLTIVKGIEEVSAISPFFSMLGIKGGLYERISAVNPDACPTYSGDKPESQSPNNNQLIPEQSPLPIPKM